MPDVPALPRPGDRLAGFRVERELGHGTTGVVYLAHQEELDRRVALKVVGRPLADDAAFRERFRREARAAAGLDHPNVVQVLETGEDDGHLWLAMRLVDGPDLSVLLRRTGRLDPEQAVLVVEQVAAALDAAHAAGLVHRDVKPGNVLIEDGPGRDLHVELADFGLARAPGPEAAAGTPGYAAPEQLAGDEAGPAADVFALGCVLFELLTGEAPPAPAPGAPAGAPWRRAERGESDDRAAGADGTAAPDGSAAPGEVAESDDPGEPGRTAEPVDASGPATAGHTSPDPAVVRAYAAAFPLVPSVAVPRLGGAFDPTLTRATDPDPAARFASAGELAMWARAALSVPRGAAGPDPADPLRAAVAAPVAPAEIGPAAPTWERPPEPRRRRRSRALLVGAFLAVVLALLGTAFVFIGTLGDSSHDPRVAGVPGAGTTTAPAPGGAPGSGAGGGAGSAGAGATGRGPGATGTGSSVRGTGSAAERAGAGTTGDRGGSAGSTGRGAGGRPAAGGPDGSGGTSGVPGSGAGTVGGPASASGSGSAGGSGSGAGAGSGGGASGDGVAGGSGGAGAGSTGAGSSSVPRAGADAPADGASTPLPPVPSGAVRFGGGGWVLDLPTAEGWRQTAVQELDGGARVVTRLQRPDAVRLVVEAVPGRTAVAGIPDGRSFPVRLADAGRTDGVLYRGGRFVMCATGVCAAVPANGPNGGVLLIASARRTVGVKRVARRAATGLRVR